MQIEATMCMKTRKLSQKSHRVFEKKGVEASGGRREGGDDGTSFQADATKFAEGYDAWRAILRLRHRMAERVGFEPTSQFPGYTLSKRAP